MPLNWQKWNGGNWTGDPETLVYVRFSDGETDEHLDPAPARIWGVDPCEPSNWRRGAAQIVAFALAP